MIPTGVARTVLVAAIVLIAAGCDEFTGKGSDQNRPAHGRHDEPSSVVMWGCGHAIPELNEHLDPRWRQGATVVGDFGFGLTAGDFSGFRRDQRADIEVKLPVIIEGHSGATVWIPRWERDRVGLILADVPRRGPANSYRVEDGHPAVRFEPCADKEWSAWTSGLALADRREIFLMVKLDDEGPSVRVPLGPWASFTRDRG
jgi:hypothetical protein